jgi:hypothetical protein
VERVFPADYDSEDVALVCIPCSLLPIISGKIAELEDYYAWRPEDYAAAYQAIAYVQECIMICGSQIAGRLDDLGVLLARAHNLSYTADMDGVLPYLGPALQAAEAADATGVLDNIHNHALLQTTNATLIDILNKLDEIKLVADTISLTCTDIEADTTSINASVTTIGDTVIGGALTITGSVNIAAGTVSVDNVDLTTLEIDVAGILASIVTGGQLYQLIDAKTFEATFDDTNIVAAIEAIYKSDETGILQQMLSLLDGFTINNLSLLSQLVSLATIAARKKPAAAIPPQITIDDFGNKGFTQPPGGVAWECPPPAEDCSEECGEGWLEVGVDESVVVVAVTGGTGYSRTEETEFRALPVPQGTENHSGCWRWKITRLRTAQAASVPYQYPWIVFDTIAPTALDTDPARIGTLFSYGFTTPGEKYIMYQQPLRRRSRATDSDPWGAWVDINEVPTDIGMVELCQVCVDDSGSAPDGGLTSQEDRCKMARWFVDNVEDTLLEAINEGVKERNRILDIYSFSYALRYLRGFLGPTINEILEARWAKKIGVAYAIGGVVLNIVERIVDNADPEMIANFDVIRADLICAVFNASDKDELLANWQSVCDAQTFNEKDKDLFAGMATNELVAWYYSYEGKKYIKARYGPFSNDCSMCSGWI